ncbi:hypothetical protein HZB01_03595 [Candidatus Woesearchaeota archaeon]|nr:hypothetical protein [Candidatus Woesearchaeota archaeon]
MISASGKVFIYSAVGFFTGLYLFYKGFTWLQQKKMIENTPTSKVRSIAMGRVEVYGAAVPDKGKVLQSPLSRKNCVYYRCIIEEYRHAGKSSRWVTLKDENDGIPFFLQDETGKVLVDPIGADIEIPKDAQYNSSFGRDPPKEVQFFLKTQNIAFEGLFGANKQMRFTEYYIAPQDKLYIMGTAMKNPAVKASAVGVENVMIAKGKNYPTYYISDRAEKDILKSLRWKVFGGIVGGAALSVVCLGIMLAYLGLF